MTAPNRPRFRFSLRTVFVAVTLSAIALVTLPWSGMASHEEWPQLVLIPIFVFGAACAFGALGVLFGRGAQAAKIGAALAIGSWLWVSWEMHIQTLDDAEQLRYWPAARPLRVAYVFGRAFTALGAAAALCLVVNRFWPLVAGRNVRPRPPQL